MKCSGNKVYKEIGCFVGKIVILPASMNSDLLVVLNMSIIAVIKVIFPFRFGDVFRFIFMFHAIRFSFLLPQNIFQRFVEKQREVFMCSEERRRVYQGNRNFLKLDSRLKCSTTFYDKCFDRIYAEFMFE